MSRVHVTTTVRIAEALYAAIKKRAAKTGHSQNVVIEAALSRDFDVAYEPPQSDHGGWPRKDAQPLKAKRKRP